MKIYTEEQLKEKIKRKNIISKIIKSIIYFIVIIMLICNSTILVQKIIMKEKYASFFGYKAFIIVSGSMEPTLNIGDIVIVKDVEQNEIKQDDIISFTENDEVITHRIVEVVSENDEKKYKTKGDNNNTIDTELVKYENIEGVYKFKIQKIGKAIMNAQTGIGIFTIICVVYIIYSIISSGNDRKNARKEKRQEIEKENKE